MTGIVTIDAALCDGCGVCVDSCPTDVLRMDAASGKAVVAYPRDCHVCFLCHNDCPPKAITVEHSGKSTRRRSVYDIHGFEGEALTFGRDLKR
jgi:NAD-dependent dihydropyrimidine dehydrogenase PreA subunit